MRRLAVLLVLLVATAAPVHAQTDALSCGDFGSVEEAQANLNADPSDPNRLDENTDGYACETVFGRRATNGPVPGRAAVPTATTAPGTPTTPTTGSTTTAVTVAPTTTPTTVPPGPVTSTATVTPSSVEAGGSVTITGSGFAPSSSLTIQLTSTSPPAALGSTQSDASGGYTATVTIPAGTSAASHLIAVSGPGAQGSRHESVGNVTVALAETGFMTSVLTAAGVVLLATGSKLVLQSQWSLPVSTAGWTPARRRRLWR